MAEETQENTRKKKMEKNIDTEKGVVTFEVFGGNEGVMSFNPNDLPKEMQKILPLYALNHMLGDATAGRRGTEAEEMIKQKWSAMMNGTVTQRKPAAPKISPKDIYENLKAMDKATRKDTFVKLQAVGMDVLTHDQKKELGLG
jgi:hypothetical protein